MSDLITLVPGQMTLAHLKRLYREDVALHLDESALAAAVRAARTVADAAAGDAAAASGTPSSATSLILE